MIKPFMAAVAILGLSACAETTTSSGTGTVTDGQIAQFNTIMRNPQQRARFIAQCEARAATYPAGSLSIMSDVMRVSVAAVPRTFCTRMTNGVVAGQVTAADFAATSGGDISPRVLAVLRAR